MKRNHLSLAIGLTLSLAALQAQAQETTAPEAAAAVIERIANGCSRSRHGEVIEVMSFD